MDLDSSQFQYSTAIKCGKEWDHEMLAAIRRLQHFQSCNRNILFFPRSFFFRRIWDWKAEHTNKWNGYKVDVYVRARARSFARVPVQIQKNKRWFIDLIDRFQFWKRLRRAHTVISFMIMGFNGSAIISLFINRENIQLYILANFQNAKGEKSTQNMLCAHTTWTDQLKNRIHSLLDIRFSSFTYLCGSVLNVVDIAIHVDSSFSLSFGQCICGVRFDCFSDRFQNLQPKWGEKNYGKNAESIFIFLQSNNLNEV